MKTTSKCKCCRKTFGVEVQNFCSRSCAASYRERQKANRAKPVAVRNFLFNKGPA